MPAFTALVLLLQAASAEESFQQVESAILKATSLSVSFDYEQTDVAGWRRGVGELLVKTGNRARFEKGEPYELCWTCDGKWVEFERRTHRYDEGIIAPDQRARRISKANPLLEKNVRLVLARAGVQAGTLMPEAFDPGSPKGFEKLLRVSQVQDGPSTGKSKSLTYRLAVGEEARPLDVTLDYDPKSFKPLKRTLTRVHEDGSKWTVTESYPRFTLDADIPAEKFTGGDK